LTAGLAPVAPSSGSSSHLLPEGRRGVQRRLHSLLPSGEKVPEGRMRGPRMPTADAEALFGVVLERAEVVF